VATTKAKTAPEAAPNDGAAARAEKKDEPKVVHFSDLELTLPAKLPGTILFDLADIEAGRDLRGTMEMVKSLVGADQYQAIRDKVADDGLDPDETVTALGNLIEGILNAHGMGSGE
jgi:hypothetical protein